MAGLVISANKATRERRNRGEPLDDETGLRSVDVRGRSYSPRGMTPEIRVDKKRHGCSILSTEINKGGRAVVVF